MIARILKNQMAGALIATVVFLRTDRDESTMSSIAGGPSSTGAVVLRGYLLTVCATKYRLLS